LTFNTYARTFKKAEQKAMNFLPHFGDFVFATSLAKVCRKQEIPRDNQRHKNSQDTLKTAFLAAQQTPEYPDVGRENCKLADNPPLADRKAHKTVVLSILASYLIFARVRILSRFFASYRGI